MNFILLGLKPISSKDTTSKFSYSHYTISVNNKKNKNESLKKALYVIKF